MKSRRFLIIPYACAFLVLAVLPAGSRADIFNFSAISNNSGQSGPMGPQFQVEVAALGSNQVSFTFYNNLVSPYTGSIKGVFFDDGTLLNLASLVEPVGVNFDIDGTPKNFPEGNTLIPPFATTFSATKYKAAANGVDPAESLGVVFDLQGGKSFADVLNAIQLGFATGGPGSLRIGIHVGSIGVNDSSDSFVMTPLPGAALLGLLGLGAAGMKLRRSI